MSTPVAPQNPTNEPSSSAAPPPTVPAGGASPSTPWKAGDQHPEWMRGKSADEVAALAMQMADALRLGVKRPEEPPPPANGNGPRMPSNDDWITQPTAAAAAVADSRFASALDPFQRSVEGMAQMMATTQRELAQQQFKDEFARWAPEIDGLIGQFAPKPEQRTLDNYKRIITYVRGQHVDELATEKARAMLATGGLGERSGGSNGMTVPLHASALQADKLGSMGKLMEQQGVTEAMVTDFCRKNNMTVDDWAKAVTENKLFTSVAPFQMQMKEEMLGAKRQFAE